VQFLNGLLIHFSGEIGGIIVVTWVEFLRDTVALGQPNESRKSPGHSQTGALRDISLGELLI